MCTLVIILSTLALLYMLIVREGKELSITSLLTTGLGTYIIIFVGGILAFICLVFVDLN